MGQARRGERTAVNGGVRRRTGQRPGQEWLRAEVSDGREGRSRRTTAVVAAHDEGEPVSITAREDDAHLPQRIQRVVVDVARPSLVKLWPGYC
jgi:hypothetical protein